MWVQSLGWEDPLEKEMATHSSILAWEILWTEESDGLHSMGGKKSDMTELLTLSLFISCLLIFPRYSVRRSDTHLVFL